MIWQRHCMRALFWAEREEAAPIQLGFLHEAQQLVVVFLGLAWVANNKVAAKRGVWAERADVGNALQEPVAIAPTAHATKVWLADMLQREVEIRHTRFEHGLDEFVGEVAWIQVQQPRALYSRAYCAHKRNDRAGTQFGWAVFPITCQVLCNEHDFFGLQFVDFTQNGFDVAAALRPTERRNRTETTIAIAAFCNFYVGPRRRRLGAWQVEQVERRNWCRRDGQRLAPELHGNAKTCNLIGLWQRLGQFGAVPLGHASRDY